MSSTSRALFVLAALVAPLGAQQRSIKVVSADGYPIPYAWVAVQGQTPRIADEKGIVALGSVGSKPLNVDVRRIGYAPNNGPITFADTATTVVIQLSALATTLNKVAITGSGPMSTEGFYKRWLKRQNGGGSGVFIGPEEIDKKNTTDLAGLLRDQNGLKLERARDGGYVLIGTGSNGCQMAVMVDGQIVRSPAESREGSSTKTGGGSALNDVTMYMTKAQKDSMNGRMNSGVERKMSDLNSQNSIKIDEVASIGSVVGVEVYNRTGNLPAELQLTDNTCGLVVIWTGARK